MNEKEYNRIFRYMAENLYPEGINRGERSNWKKKCEPFIIKDQKLWYKHKYGQPLKVVKRNEEMNNLLHEFHMKEEKHLGINKMRKALNKKYYWKTITKDVDKYVKECNHCKTACLRLTSAHGWKSKGLMGNGGDSNMITKKTDYVSLISSCIEQINSLPNMLFSFDISGPLTQTHTGNQYIVLGTNEDTKFTDFKILREATTEAVAKFIYNRFILVHGYMISIKIMKSCSRKDAEFYPRLKDKLCSSPYKVTLNSFPIITEENELECFNSALLELIEQCINDFSELQYTWDVHVSKIVLSYNTFPKQQSPYYRTYNKHPSLQDISGEESDLYEWTVKRLNEFNVIGHP